MLYEVVLIFAMTYIALSPLLLIKGIKIGVKMTNKPQEVIEEPVFNVPKKKKNKAKMTPEQARAMDILKNIEMYDGTSNGQREIKNGTK